MRCHEMSQKCHKRVNLVSKDVTEVSQTCQSGVTRCHKRSDYYIDDEWDLAALKEDIKNYKRDVAEAAAAAAKAAEEGEGEGEGEGAEQ